MSNKTIAKFVGFVICCCAAASACDRVPAGPPNAPIARGYKEPEVIGTITSGEILEGSGLAPSRCQDNVLWTHNDSGDGPFVYAVNTQGKRLGTWQVTGAQNIDWEDIATIKDTDGRCRIYIGEIGNNHLERHEHIVYRVAEPTVSPDDKDSSTKHPVPTEACDTVKFRYPDTEHNAESLLVHPRTGDIYVVSKQITGPAGVYKITPSFGDNKVEVAAHIADISVPAIPNGLLTGGDVSPDAVHVMICDYTQAYEYVLPAGDTNFDDIWRQDPMVVDLGKRRHGESIGYSADGASVYATSEGQDSPVIRVDRAQ